MKDTIFEQILQTCPEKKIVSRCKKLTKKSALTSGATATTLAELAYWLFVYGYENEALLVCGFSHIDDPPPFKVNYNVWDYILWVWGLEAYIYRRRNEDKKCADLIAAMERVWSIPCGIYDTVEKKTAQLRQIQSGLTFEDAISKDKIERALADGSKSEADAYRFVSLFKMIGYGVTGLYPQLEEHKEELEEKIRDYIQLIK